MGGLLHNLVPESVRAQLVHHAVDQRMRYSRGRVTVKAVQRSRVVLRRGDQPLRLIL